MCFNLMRTLLTHAIVHRSIYLSIVSGLLYSFQFFLSLSFPLATHHPIESHHTYLDPRRTCGHAILSINCHSHTLMPLRITGTAGMRVIFLRISSRNIWSSLLRTWYRYEYQSVMNLFDWASAILRTASVSDELRVAGADRALTRAYTRRWFTD